jgi:hypothetical protein
MSFGQSFKWFRSVLILAIWIPCAWGLVRYVETEIEHKRFETLILSNGKVSSIQRESLFSQENVLRPGDRILTVVGEKFDFVKTKALIHALPNPRAVRAEILSKNEKKEVNLLVREYSKRDVLTLGILPAVVAVIFLLFSLLTPFQKLDQRKNRESVEVFAFVFCRFAILLGILSRSHFGSRVAELYCESLVWCNARASF